MNQPNIKDLIRQAGEGVVKAQPKKEDLSDEDILALFGEQKKKTLWQRIRKAISRLMGNH